MQTQPLSSKLGEIKYRSQIVEQHVGKKTHFIQEPNQQEIKGILKQRLLKYRFDFDNLSRRGLINSPFLEIGSEYSLASSYLTSKLKKSGAAIDISFHSLSNASYFAKLFKLNKVPTLICADANNLPFKSNSIHFIFVYESLHHFPHPKPVLAEIKRVLSPGGTLFIGAEPIKQTFQIKLWRRPTKLRNWEKFLKATLILPFISHIGKSEVDSGILEEAFRLNTWVDSLSIFDSFEAKIEIPYINLHKQISKTFPSAFPLSLLVSLIGGGIQAICTKAKKSQQHETQKVKSFQDILICPNCKVNFKREVSLKNFSCPRCNSKYTQKNRVSILLQAKIAKHLSKNI